MLRWWRIRRLRDQMVQRGDLEPGIALRNRQPKVHPLPVDILNTYPVELYNQEKIKNNSCAICLDDFVPDKNTVRVLPCRHGFCTGCIGKLFINATKFDMDQFTNLPLFRSMAH